MVGHGGAGLGDVFGGTSLLHVQVLTRPPLSALPPIARQFMTGELRFFPCLVPLVLFLVPPYLIRLWALDGVTSLLTLRHLPPSPGEFSLHPPGGQITWPVRTVFG